MSEPLNPLLYAMLVKRYGDVEIAYPGEAIGYTYQFNPLKDRNELRVWDSGEQYRINCPICGDQRKRLYISYCWFYRDDTHGQTWDHLIYCHNESGQCYSTYEERNTLYRALFAQTGFRQTAPTQRLRPMKKVEAAEVPEQEWPGKVVPIQDLPADHEAVEYLEERCFDIDELGRDYQLQYCTRSYRYELPNRRIIVPAYLGGKLVGWQARYVGDLNWKLPESPPKYFTLPGMKRGRIVYNLDKAKDYRTVVVMEGPADVWSFGQMGVAVWGSTPVAAQKHMLIKECSRGSCVLLMDPEVMKDTRKVEKARHGLEGVFSGGLAQVVLPEGSDPGSLDREWLREFVQAEAASQGVTVSYETW